MRDSSRRALAQFRRIRDFLVRTQPAVTLGDLAPHVATFGSVIDRLTALVVEQDTRARQGLSGTSAIRRRARLLRLEVMRPVALMARTLFPESEGPNAALRLPRNLRRAEALIASAHAMADAASTLRDDFVAGGFPPDFVEQLHHAADHLKEAIDARAHEIGRRAASAVGAVTETARGRAFLRLIDGMVAPRFEETPELLAEWRSLLRQGRARRRGGVMVLEEGEAAATEAREEREVVKLVA